MSQYRCLKEENFSCHLCWPKTNKVPGSIPAKWIYLRSAENSNYRICNYGNWPASPNTARERGFYREEKEVGRDVVDKESMLFTGWILAKKKDGSSFSRWTLLWSLGVRMSPSDLPTLFHVPCLLLSFFFLTFPNRSMSFFISITDQESGCLASPTLCSSILGRILLVCSISCGRKTAQIGKLLKSHSRNKEG